MNPCSIRISKYGDHWVAATAQASGEPIDLAELITQSPEFLGMLEPAKPMPRAVMVAPQSTSERVMVAVDEAGGISLVGCPDFKLDGGAGAVVSDLLAANGRLWHQKPDVLIAPFKEVLCAELVDWIAGRAGKNWSAQAFMAGIQKCLEQGRFPILIVVSRLDDAAKEMLSYLQNMNLDVRPLGYELFRGDGVEVIRPKLLAAPREAAPPKPESKPEPKPAEVATGKPVEAGSRTVEAGIKQAGQTMQQGSFRVETHPAPIRPTCTESTAAPVEPEPAPRGPDSGGFPDEDATPKQREILSRLLGIDSLGLKRRGSEYFLPARANQKEADTGTIVVAVNADRWPFPTKDEVIVVVNTGADHLAGYLDISPGEIEEFLGSLPRAERKEHKGSLLLRANTLHEATQLVNELRALKAVSAGGFG